MLQRIIPRLNEKEYTLLSLQMEKSNASKYLLMLDKYRNDNISDQELIKQLNINVTTFYTVKSRLSEKIQLFMLENVEDSQTELLRNVSKIEHIVNNIPRETSIKLLKRLETELIKNDMPKELSMVYKAQKKLHHRSSKYYDYDRLYNIQIAYYLAQNKAEDVLSVFCKLLEDFYLSRGDEELNRLILLKKEMDSICRLYPSYRLDMLKKLLDIQYFLFIDTAEYTSPSLEVLLSESKILLKKFEKNNLHLYLELIIDYLYFEYYVRLKSIGSSNFYYNKLLNKIDTLLLLDHTCFSGYFFISGIKAKFWQGQTNRKIALAAIYEDDFDKKNTSRYIFFTYYKATTAFYQGNYTEAIQILNRALRELNLKEVQFAEVEIKLFLVLLYFFSGDETQANHILRKLMRKIPEKKRNAPKYFCVSNFIDFLKSLREKEQLKSKDKCLQLNRCFQNLNTGTYRILEFLVIKDEMLENLCYQKKIVP